MSILKKTSVTPEPLSAIHFTRIFSLQLFLWPFSCPLTPVLNQLFLVFPHQYQNRVVGYSFTLSEILDPPLLVSEVPSPCRTIPLLLHKHFPILLPSPLVVGNLNSKRQRQDSTTLHVFLLFLRTPLEPVLTGSDSCGTLYNNTQSVLLPSTPSWV